MMEIYAALIGAGAVVIGVFLAQFLTTYYREKQVRQTLSQKLSVVTSELFRGMEPDADPIDWSGESVRIRGLLSEMGDACAHMRRKRRKAVDAVLDECRTILINAPGRARNAGGKLPLPEGLAVIEWLSTAESAVGENRAVVQEGPSPWLFYATNGLNAKRPGAPPHLVPQDQHKNVLQQVRLKVAARRRARKRPTEADGTVPS
jgi:hypothetical protein